MILPELSILKNYRNPQVISYFCHHHPEFSLDDAQVVFEDLLAWLWLNKHRELMGKKTYLFGSLLILDEMWHSFILHTREYIDFSIHYFATYYHHDIEPIGFEYILEEAELSEFIQDCFKYLETGWVERRFANALESSQK